MALLLVLPPLAIGLEAFGWRDRVAQRLRLVRSSESRVVAGYALWTAVSASLSLDVAAVAAASVGPAAADDARDRSWHLSAAILGANLGSLLFPFSNLTNLVLMASAGLGFLAYVETALAPQLIATLTGAVVLVWRIRRTRDKEMDRAASQAQPDRSHPASRTEIGALAAAAIGSVGAIAAGLRQEPVVVPFALAAAAVSGAAIAGGRQSPIAVARAMPLGGIAVIAGAWLLTGAMAAAGSHLATPGADVPGLVEICLVGGVLSMTLNNLPAAAFGAFWLGSAAPVAVVAYLIGTNFSAVATPHGSVATLLARSVAKQHGPVDSSRAYVASFWWYALATTITAFVVLVIIR